VFCSANYGVTFPMTEKIEVNGDGRHEIYQALVTTPNEKGYVADIEWNFEKFLIDGSGEIVARFRAGVLPDDPRVLAAIDDLV
jgi:glutathione peroxidase